MLSNMHAAAIASSLDELADCMRVLIVMGEAKYPQSYLVMITIPTLRRPVANRTLRLRLLQLLHSAVRELELAQPWRPLQ